MCPLCAHWRWCAGIVLVVALAAALYAGGGPATHSFTPQQLRYWAFQKVVKPAPPAVKNTAWPANEIDAFVLAKLEEKNLAPNPPADRPTLIRRASLTLTGLPPTPDEVQAFVADTDANAFEKVVDRLLASPRYGERWARHWLDLARYADSEGFKADETRPNIWRYRDYVIQSFNEDKPYDRFVQEQIAGDEMYPESLAAAVATGFNRHFPDESNARNIAQRRQELLNDITDATAATFLGMTYACARCHDHKFDPILHKDYYRLQAFFANTRIEDSFPLLGAKRRAHWQEKQADWENRTREVRAEMRRLLQPKMQALWQDGFEKFPPEIQSAVTTPADRRTPFQWQMYYKAKPQLEVPEELGIAKLRGAEKARYQELKSELAKFDAFKPEAMPYAQAMIDNGRIAPATHVLSGGAYDARQDEVRPGFLTILDASDAAIPPPPGVNSSGRRSALARWLSDPANPLTARVMANRIWHHQFGRGIVGTPSDFGVMGDRPTHRELLDWLAATFVADGWSVKSMQKRIMLSKTWQQSAAYREEAAAADPENKLLWRAHRRRLEGEVIRDSMLAVSGQLNTKMFGPGVFPPLPPGMTTRGGWLKQEDAADAQRRSVYIFVRRNTRYPMLETFDMPDTHESCGRRNTTVTPTQALGLLNDELVLGWARGLAQRVKNDTGLTDAAQVDRAWKLVYGRTPAEDERTSAVAFLARQQEIAGSRDRALVDLCQMLLNSNEFLYLN